MKRLLFVMLLILLALAACTGQGTPVVIVVTVTPAPITTVPPTATAPPTITSTPAPTATPTITPTRTPTIEPTPTIEDVGEPINPGAYFDGDPVTLHKGRPGVDPDILVQVPPQWAIIGFPGADGSFADGLAPWPSVFKKGAGLASNYEFAMADRSGRYGFQAFVVHCDRCLVVARADYDLRNKPGDTFQPSQVVWGGEALPTSGNDGTCKPTEFPPQSPETNHFTSPDWQDQAPVGLWLINTHGADIVLTVWFDITYADFGDNSYIWWKSLEVRPVSPDYGDAPISVQC